MCVVLIPLYAAIAIPSFVKARTTAQKNACINNLRQIDAAKEQWALATGATTGAVDEAGCDVYITAPPLVCPAGGSYTYNELGVDPTCDAVGHVL
jgi:hypothetical protein